MLRDDDAWGPASVIIIVVGRFGPGLRSGIAGVKQVADRNIAVRFIVAALDASADFEGQGSVDDSASDI